MPHDGQSRITRLEMDAHWISLRLFGAVHDLETTPDRFLSEDSIWRAANIYSPFFSAHPLPRKGVAIDVGAGFGSFAIPFAAAFPGWTVWAFEPDEEAFAALTKNIDRLSLGNVVAVNAAVGGNNPASGGSAMVKAIVRRDADSIRKLAASSTYRQSRELQGFVELVEGPDAPPTGDGYRSFPTVPAGSLAAIGPNLLKLTAPLAEAAILAGVADCDLSIIVGEIWQPLPSGLVTRSTGPRRDVYLPVAGSPLKLRHSAHPAAPSPGLDVVVAMYNTAPFIEECVESLLADGNPEIRVIVVDDGSTDGSGDIVRKAFGEHPRLRLLTKPNGGCASARNFGRMHSNAGHIAFVDADDRMDHTLFSELLELARYSGAEIIQGGFAFFNTGPEGERLDPSYEDREFSGRPRYGFGHRSYFVLPSADLQIGQPAIWRRIYRRDFLDNKKIWFPEHIRAFDDQIFQMLTLKHANDIYCVDHVRYHYRQHPGQDIKQGDERNFYSLEMFRLMIKRGLAEGWNDFDPVLTSFVNTFNWIHAGLRPDLKPKFLAAAAELWTYMGKALGDWTFRNHPPELFAAPDFRFHLKTYQERLASYPGSFAFSYLDATGMHRSLV